METKVIKIYYCKEKNCPNKISQFSKHYGLGRCYSCAQKERFKKSKPKSYIDGRTLKKYYCIDCIKEIGYFSHYYGNHRCKSCSRKGKLHILYNKHRSNITKRKISLAKKGTKPTEETRRRQSISRGGTGIPYENSEYGAEFDDSLKEKIRFRDGYKCKLCGCSQLENGKQLDVHHINYDKRNNKLNNLISLCRKCHMKTNYTRKNWVEKCKMKI